MRLRLLFLVFGLPLGLLLANGGCLVFDLLRRRPPRLGAGALESSAGGQP